MIYVGDLSRSRRFYLTIGLKLIVDTDHYVRFAFPEGESTFSIHLADKASPGSAMIYFEVADVDEVFANLSKRGIGFDDVPEDKPWLWREVHLTDPDGYKLCLFQAGENRLDPPWRVDSEPS